MSKELKPSFYKNSNEMLLKLAVDKLYNDYVGGEENHFLDHQERYFNFTEKSLIEDISKEILTAKNLLWLENGGAIEAKHVRFIGEKRIKEIVEHRVKYRHKKEGWCFEGCTKVFKDTNAKEQLYKCVKDNEWGEKSDMIGLTMTAEDWRKWAIEDRKPLKEDNDNIEWLTNTPADKIIERIEWLYNIVIEPVKKGGK